MHTGLYNLNFLIFLLLFILIPLVFLNIQIKIKSDKKIANKSASFYNMIGFAGIVCVLILIADNLLNRVSNESGNIY